MLTAATPINNEQPLTYKPFDRSQVDPSDEFAPMDLDLDLNVTFDNNALPSDDTMDPGSFDIPDFVNDE